QRVPGLRQLGLLQSVVSPRRPVQPWRAIVRPRKPCGCAFEHPNGVRVLLIPVGEPSNLPGGALGVASTWKSRVHLPEGFVCSCILVVDDKMRREVVERLLGP